MFAVNIADSNSPVLFKASGTLFSCLSILLTDVDASICRQTPELKLQMWTVLLNQFQTQFIEMDLVILNDFEIKFPFLMKAGHIKDLLSFIACFILVFVNRFTKILCMCEVLDFLFWFNVCEVLRLFV